jgi:hypothetical protein
MPSPDKRRSPRVRRRLRVIIVDGNQQRGATTTNLSSTGFSMLSQAPLLPGAEVNGWVVLPTATITFRAEVMWSRRPTGKAADAQCSVGLRFLGPLDQRYERFLGLEMRQDEEPWPVYAPAPALAPQARPPTPPPFGPPFGPRLEAPASAPLPSGAPPLRLPTLPPVGPPVVRAPELDAPVPAPLAEPKLMPSSAPAIAPLATLPVDAETDETLVAADLVPGDSSLSLLRATAMIEEVLVIAMAGHGAAGKASVGVEMAVVVEPEPLAPGTRVRVIATMVQQTGDRQAYFASIVRAGRTLARCRYVRRLVPRR